MKLPNFKKHLWLTIQEKLASGQKRCFSKKKALRNFLCVQKSSHGSCPHVDM